MYVVLCLYGLPFFFFNQIDWHCQVVCCFCADEAAVGREVPGVDGGYGEEVGRTPGV